MTDGHEHATHGHVDFTHSTLAKSPFHVVALRGAEGERRFPVDLIREELLSLPTTTWIAFQGDELGEPPAYAADLMRRLVRLKCNWVGQASLSFADKPTL